MNSNSETASSNEGHGNGEEGVEDAAPEPTTFDSEDQGQFQKGPTTVRFDDEEADSEAPPMPVVGARRGRVKIDSATPREVMAPRTTPASAWLWTPHSAASSKIVTPTPQSAQSVAGNSRLTTALLRLSETPRESNSGAIKNNNFPAKFSSGNEAGQDATIPWNAMPGYATRRVRGWNPPLGIGSGNSGVAFGSGSPRRSLMNSPANLGGFAVTSGDDKFATGSNVITESAYEGLLTVSKLTVGLPPAEGTHRAGTLAPSATPVIKHQPDSIQRRSSTVVKNHAGLKLAGSPSFENQASNVTYLNQNFRSKSNGINIDGNQWIQNVSPQLQFFHETKQHHKHPKIKQKRGGSPFSPRGTSPLPLTLRIVGGAISTGDGGSNTARQQLVKSPTNPTAYYDYYGGNSQFIQNSLSARYTKESKPNFAIVPTVLTEEAFVRLQSVGGVRSLSPTFFPSSWQQNLGGRSEEQNNLMQIPWRLRMSSVPKSTSTAMTFGGETRHGRPQMGLRTISDLVLPSV